MTIELIILLTIISIIIYLIWLFNTKKEILNLIHIEKIVTLKNTIDVNKTQVQKRSEFLDKYHFSKYNLSESLLKQPEIIL